ncbi:MAG: hypothetical protein MUF23_17035, partial [Pirellula sp.]|nr:hypothetical protein [Pirellula sp.]
HWVGALSGVGENNRRVSFCPFIFLPDVCVHRLGDGGYGAERDGRPFYRVGVHHLREGGYGSGGWLRGADGKQHTFLLAIKK